MRYRVDRLLVVTFWIAVGLAAAANVPKKAPPPFHFDYFLALLALKISVMAPIAAIVAAFGKIRASFWVGGGGAILLVFATWALDAAFA